jgi:SAM-dependent methyltransferase
MMRTSDSNAQAWRQNPSQVKAMRNVPVAEDVSAERTVFLWKDWFHQFGNYLHARRLEILRQLIPRQFSSGLDVGCAAGILNIMGFSNVIGIDIVGGSNVTVLASAEYLPFRTEAFQLVFAGEVIEHLREPVRALKEWVRVLRKGGKMIISTPNGLRVNVYSGNPEHKRMFGPHDLCRTLRRMGLDVTYTKGIFTGLVSGRRLFRWIPFANVKMALLRFPIPMTLSYDFFIGAEKR